ncbi:MAG: LexA family protein, partial [Gammaproteobacteria bacterium]
NWARYLLRTGVRKRTMEADGATKRSTPQDIPSAGRCPTQARYTVKQGQYLAFIYYYTKIHGRSPSEADIQSFFRVSPPAVHQMVLSLERRGFIERTPGQARSLKLLLNREQLPDLM